MALSGSATKSFGAGHQLQVRWDATQNVAGNYSHVNVTLWLYRAFTWNASAPKNAYVMVNGSKYSFTCTVGGGAGWTQLGGVKAQWDIKHNDDGTQSITVTGYCDVAVTLSGTYYGGQTASNTFTLDTIQRGTYATGWQTWPTTPNGWDFINMFWATADHPDELWLHVNGGGRIATGQPTDSTQKNGVIKATGLKPNTSYNLQLEIVRNGVVSWSPVVTASTKKAASAVSISSSTWNPDDALSITITNPDKAYIRFHMYIEATNSSGVKENSFVCSIDTGASTSYTWTLSDDASVAVYNKMKYANTGTVTLYAMNYVPSSYETWITNVSTTFTISIDTATYSPVLPASLVSLALDSVTSSVMGSTSTNLIQGISSLSASIDTSQITLYKNAGLKSLTFKYGNNTDTWTKGGTFTKTLNGFLNTGNYTVQVYATDTRGNKSATVKKTYTIVSYKTPVIVPTVTRELSSGGKIDISFQASYSRLLDNNSIGYIKYGYAIFGSTPTANTAITEYTSSDASNGVDKSLSYSSIGSFSLDESKNYRFIFVIKDKIKEYSVEIDLVDGNPIMRVLETGQVTINCKPDTSNQDEKLRVNGDSKIIGELTLLNDLFPDGLNIAEIIKQILDTSFDREHPVGSIFMSVLSDNPATYLGKGTWVAWGSGRVPVSVDTSQTEFNAVEKTGGNKSVNLSHQHTESLGWDKNNIYLNYVNGNTTSGGGSVVVDVNSRYMTAPSGQTHPGRFNLTSSSLNSTSLLQPYITCYMWKRTA